MKSLSVRSLASFGLCALALLGASRVKADDIIDTAVKAGSFKTLVAAVKAAGLVDAFKGPGPFTIFAPTDAAFAKVPRKTLANLLKPENKAQLAAILKYHVLSGTVEAADVMKLKSGVGVKTLHGETVTVRHTSKGVTVNRAHVVKADIRADNGVIHVIDAVLMPPMK